MPIVAGVDVDFAVFLCYVTAADVEELLVVVVVDAALWPIVAFDD